MASDSTDADTASARPRRKVVPFRRPDRAPAEPIEPAATNDQAMVERGRRIGGAAGATMAGIMVALRDIYESPKRDDGAVVVDSPSEPHDADRDGMQFAADDLGGNSDVEIAALERKDPVVVPRRRRGLRRPRH